MSVWAREQASKSELTGARMWETEVGMFFGQVDICR